MQVSSSSSSTLCDSVPRPTTSARAMVMQFGGHTSTQSPHRMHRLGIEHHVVEAAQAAQRLEPGVLRAVADLDLAEADPPVARRRRDRLAGDGVVAGRQSAEPGAGGSARSARRRRARRSRRCGSTRRPAARRRSRRSGCGGRGRRRRRPRCAGCDVRSVVGIDLDAAPARARARRRRARRDRRSDRRRG